MELRLVNLGKRFAHKWLYRNINFSFDSSHRYAITGPNGSGKSTLLKLIANYMSPSEGGVEYWINGQMLEREHIYNHISYTAPYMQLIEEFTLSELFKFHQVYRSMQASEKEWMDILKLNISPSKQIKYFSSGMKQRTNLALILCTKADVYLIDEPTTNLDHQGKTWYLELLERFCKQSLTIIASNDSSDFSFCDQMINVENLKTKHLKYRR